MATVLFDEATRKYPKTEVPAVDKGKRLLPVPVMQSAYANVDLF